MALDTDGGGKGRDGWQYALNWNTGWLSSSNAITLVRRRRWVRRAELVLPETAAAAAARGSGIAYPPPTYDAPAPARSPASSSPKVKQTSPPKAAEHETARALAGAPPPPPLVAGGDGSSRKDLLLERAHALREALDDVHGGVTVSPGRDAAAGRRESIDPSGIPWNPLVSGGAALFQLSTAPGAHVRVRGQQMELNGQPTLLFDHLAELLQEQLTRHPWYAEPLRIACERARLHLGSSRLRVSSALKVDMSVDGNECFVVVEGIPEAAETAAASSPESGKSDAAGISMTSDAVPISDGDSATGAECGTFINEINLLDLVTDVQDIYNSFYKNVAGENLKAREDK